MIDLNKLVVRSLWLITLFAGTFVPMLCYGHNWNVHDRIAESAYQSSRGAQTFVSEVVESDKLTTFMAPHNTGYSACDWLRSGSIMEDEEAWKRCLDHFYTVQPNRTPGQTIGLTDWSKPTVLGLFAPISQRWGV